MKKFVHYAFVALLVVLGILICREWTIYYFGESADADYGRVYRAQIEEGHHSFVASSDASNMVMMIWFAGCCFILAVTVGGGGFWSYTVLWPQARSNL